MTATPDAIRPTATEQQEAMRLRVVNVTSLVTFALAVINLASFLFNHEASGVPLELLLAYVPLAALDGVAAFGRRLRTGLRAGLLLFSWGAVGVTSTLQLGFLSTPLVVDLVTVVLAGLFFGPRATVIAFAASSVVILLSAALHVTGVLPTPPLSVHDMARADTWGVVVVAYVSFGGMAVLAYAFMLRKLAEALQESSALVDSLRAEVKERVAAHAALETSQEQVLALQRNELLSRLASSVAHDFNNLLTVMVAEATFLRESEDEAARESAALIHEAAKQGTALTRQLLLLSRHDVAQKAVVDAGASARGIERTIRRLMPAHVHLEVSSPESPCPVVIDETHLQQALMNLALNARDAIAREGRIQVSVARLDAPPPGAHRRDGTPVAAGRFVRIQVEDTGVGMDEATRKRALESFFMTKDRGKGTGLGLFTVLSVVEGNGGWLDLASDPGRGTSVSLYFPEADAAAIESRQGDWLRPPPSQPRRVLLADDNEGVRQTLVRALEGAGHHVTVTSDAGAAIRALDEARVPFDAVVSDGVMPQGSGLDVLVHAARVAPGARRVLITGYLELDTSAVEFHGSGFTVLKKPFQPEDLLAALDAEVPRSER